MNKKAKYSLISLGILFLIWQSYAVYIDMYNFKQLEKAKPILESINSNDKEFFSLKEFNKQYNQNITPIKNCYDVNNYNANGEYMFGFKLESLIYICVYGGKYFAYPKYNLPKGRLCFGLVVGGGDSGCYDNNRLHFETVVSNPCSDKEE